MNIVIIGAGAVGGYLAEILSKEKCNVILIDQDEHCLAAQSQDADVAIRHGNGTDWQLLDDLLELSPDLLIAVTDSDEVNLVACSIAKELGYLRTIARVRGRRYLSRSRLDFGRLFHADDLVGPEQLVADDMYKYMSSPGSLAIEHFAHGAVQLRTIVVPEKWRHGDAKLRDLKLPEGMVVGLLRRSATDGKKRVIFPHGNDCIRPGDEVTVIGETDVVSDVHFFFGSSQKRMESVVIVGGSLTGLNLATILERKGISVRIIEKNVDRCRSLAERLTRAVVIHDDGTSMDVLLNEKVSRADLVVACTEKDEVNIMVALLAKEAGCQDALIMMSDTRYTPLVEKLGISHTVSPRVSATNRILSLVREQTVTSMVSVYEHQAEIAELQVSSHSQLAGIPISELGSQLPKDFLIAVIQNRGRIMIADGNRILSPGDTVIVVTHPNHINELEKVF
ncbi:Trk system potassium uptake protein TrkA homolog 1 [Chlamydiales bacterium SCGC AG-110-P3]|nr:Trk system potassium uptake protein TrkA homolog 1 [Chlamydiales bacterium SCGC AG-110-P3]